MTSTLERAAKVIYEKINGQPGVRFIPDGPPFAWEELTPDSKRPFLEHARAVLDAIREPSEGMEEAAGNRDTIGYDPPPSAVWQAMIDAALADGGLGEHGYS